MFPTPWPEVRAATRCLPALPLEQACTCWSLVASNAGSTRHWPSPTGAASVTWMSQAGKDEPACPRTPLRSPAGTHWEAAAGRSIWDGVGKGGHAVARPRARGIGIAATACLPFPYKKRCFRRRVQGAKRWRVHVLTASGSRPSPGPRTHCLHTCGRPLQGWARERSGGVSTCSEHRDHVHR